MICKTNSNALFYYHWKQIFQSFHLTFLWFFFLVFDRASSLAVEIKRNYHQYFFGMICCAVFSFFLFHSHIFSFRITSFTLLAASRNEITFGQYFSLFFRTPNAGARMVARRSMCMQRALYVVADSNRITFYCNIYFCLFVGILLLMGLLFIRLCVYVFVLA